MKSLITVLLITSISSALTDSLQTNRSFSHKVIYSETADKLSGWSGGIRTSLAIPVEAPFPIPTIDAFININGLMRLEIIRSGWNKLRIDTATTLTDLFWTVGLNSKPYFRAINGMPYYVNGGIKLFSSRFEMVNIPESDTIRLEDKSVILQIVQTLKLSTSQRINLLSSLSFRESGSSTYYLVPSYTFRLGSKWSASLEYYMTNSLTLPYKVLQFMMDEDALDFYNIERNMVSFMLYGLSYGGKYFRLDLTLGSHISFTPPHIIMIGAGWQF